jgi:hypothetical protein
MSSPKKETSSSASDSSSSVSSSSSSSSPDSSSSIEVISEYLKVLNLKNKIEPGTEEIGFGKFASLEEVSKNWEKSGLTPEQIREGMPCETADTIRKIHLSKCRFSGLGSAPCSMRGRPREVTAP